MMCARAGSFIRWSASPSCGLAGGSISVVVDTIVADVLEDLSTVAGPWLRPLTGGVGSTYRVCYSEYGSVS